MFCYLILVVGIAIVDGFESGNPEICLSHGTCFRGSWVLENHKRFAAFRGIRYALPPVGRFRFQKPSPFIAGSDMSFDVSNNFNLQCAQFDTQTASIIGSEDCLFLNIYLSEHLLKSDSLWPVMFFIHGGALIEGSGIFDQYGPHYFMNRDIILVTINYRLGTLGFLSLGTSNVPGNAGLRDQVLAMQWVGDNIASFHGDPNCVTIFGESAGSQSVGLHLVSPLSQGLFQRAILQSGTPTVSWASASQTEALTMASKLIQDLDCENSAVLECLQSKTVEELLLRSDKILNYPVSDHGFVQDPYLPDDPEALFRLGKFDSEIDVMIGHTKDEGLYYLLDLEPRVLANPEKWSDLRENFDIYGPSYLFEIKGREITANDIAKANQVVEFYIGSKENMNEEHLQGIIDMFSDAGFFYDDFRMIEYFLQHGLNPHFYVLSYEGHHSYSEIYGVEPKGVSHADDLLYQWHNLFAFYNLTNEEDIAVRNVVLDAWTNFAKSGKPNAYWSKVESSDSISYFNIHSSMPSMDMIDSDLKKRMMEFWQQILNTF